eukprot:2137949-Rhodomonas_salina.2
MRSSATSATTAKKGVSFSMQKMVANRFGGQRKGAKREVHTSFHATPTREDVGQREREKRDTSEASALEAAVMKDILTALTADDVEDWHYGFTVEQKRQAQHQDCPKISKIKPGEPSALPVRPRQDPQLAHNQHA